MLCLAGPISKTISTQGMKAVYEALDAQGKKTFEEAYAASYGPATDVSALEPARACLSLDCP